MTSNTYRVIFIAAAAALSLAYTGSPAAHDCNDQEDKSAAAESPTVFADQNRDGKVTKREAKVDANLSRIFKRYDQDDDGELSRAEFAQLEADSRTHLESAEVSHSLRPRHVVHPAPQ